MQFLIVDIVLRPFGWLILYIKYRDPSKINSIVKSEYDDDYSNVAKDYLFSIVLILFGVLLIVFMIVMLIITIFR